MYVAYSVNGVPIRLTDERWTHIVENKPYMFSLEMEILKAIEDPTFILRGYAGSLIAILAIARKRYLHVVYKEINAMDGFIVTAYVSDDYNHKLIVWPRKS